MEGFCRGCLIKYDDNTELLQYTEKNRRLYVYSTGIQAKRNDTFPFQICKDCYMNMMISCKFKKQCRASDKRFKNYSAMKAAGDSLDFCTFLKNNDDSYMFRLPIISGNSTPANQKARDDDNESTCTSIRNFMTDILQVDEMPDTEARIIREVIEEEADVLDDSLDSHWLQDDASIDTDFRLDLSFSPFSTPRTVNNERCYTPQKLSESAQPTMIHDDDKPYELNTMLDENSPHLNSTPPSVNNLRETPVEIDETEIDKCIIDNIEEVEEIDNAQSNDPLCTVIQQSENSAECPIDKNLERAINNENKTEYSLDELLLTPEYTGTRCATGASTPTITNILFGTKQDLNDDNSNSAHVVGQCIEKFEDVQGDMDILDKLFYTETEKLIISKDFLSPKENECIVTNNKEMIEPNTDNVPTKSEPINTIYDLTDCFCKLCKKKFKNSKGLKVHFHKVHDIKLEPDKKQRDNKVRICNYCAQEIVGYINLKKHIKSHMTRAVNALTNHVCKYCLQKFDNKWNLKQHMITHREFEVKPKNKKYVCNICGMCSTTSGNLGVHIRRHTKNYLNKCELCDQGFYRKNDLTLHMRMHTGDKRFECQVCMKRFYRRDMLSRHLKIHTDERPFQCEHCNSRFIRQLELIAHLRKSQRCLKIRIGKTEPGQFCCHNEDQNTNINEHSNNGTDQCESDEDEFVIVDDENEMIIVDDESVISNSLAETYQSNNEDHSNNDNDPSKEDKGRSKKDKDGSKTNTIRSRIVKDHTNIGKHAKKQVIIDDDYNISISDLPFKEGQVNKNESSSFLPGGIPEDRETSKIPKKLFVLSLPDISQ